ncbi:hypothetical protein HOLleu_44376 [Holothuria leucospilota]|uniref:Uncharacterized protein n=1 Tax=Holothuria leucospilota TaxID=206669 RepID=A0A9Q0YCI4_HOLLE|nr:hypothetical protein HOLleu_44376 [Holothuria leucospilota]
MCYGKRKKPISFEGSQRSSGVTGGQTLKTLLTRYLKINDGSINSHVTDSRLLSMDPVLCGSANFILQAAVGISILKCGDQDFYSHFKEKQSKREKKTVCLSEFAT